MSSFRLINRRNFEKVRKLLVNQCALDGAFYLPQGGDTKILYDLYSSMNFILLHEPLLAEFIKEFQKNNYRSVSHGVKK